MPVDVKPAGLVRIEGSRDCEAITLASDQYWLRTRTNRFSLVWRFLEIETH